MKKLKKLERFKEKVLSSYDVYNNIFLTLPFESINDTGKLLPIFSNYCLEGYNKKYSPQEIVDGFFEFLQYFSKKPSTLSCGLYFLL